MMYVGSKRRIAKHIRDEVHSRKGDRGVYWEPFCGGLNSFSVVAPGFDKAIASDSHADLIMMWKAVFNGWQPPMEVSEDYYRALRDAGPSPMRGFVGFGCSFGSKWFGGYARSSAQPKNYAGITARSIEKKRKALEGTDVRFANISVPVDVRVSDCENLVIYCDPPYANTLGYKGSGSFDHELFWRWCRTQSKCGAVVLVSEYSAPDDIECIAEYPHSVQIDSSVKTRASVERLYIV